MTQERLIIESMFQIPDKSGNDVPFVFNDIQAKFDDEYTGRDLVTKGRQGGVSSQGVGRSLAKCLHKRNRRCVIVAHDIKTTQKLIDKVHYILKHLPAPADMEVQSRHELKFNKTDSTISIGTAGNDDVGIGDPITDLHCSEVPRWKAPHELLGGLFNSVPPDGTVLIEATGKGIGNWFHREAMRCAAGNGSYKFHFFPWTMSREYVIAVPDKQHFLATLDQDLEEDQVWATGLVTVEQLAWRRAKIREMDYDLQRFKENFPLTVDECFQGTGASFFKKVRYEPTAAWHASDRWDHFWIYGDHPKVGHAYVAGADTSGGVGKDSSVLEIFSITEGRQVGEWVSNKFEPHRFASAIRPILDAFGNPYINIERNNQGILTIKEFMQFYPPRSLHMSRPPKAEIDEYGKIADFGTFTSAKNRTDVIGALRKACIDEFAIHSPILKGEMDSFVEKENGKCEAQEGCNDDTIMAAAMSLYVAPKVAARFGYKNSLLNPRSSDPFSLDYILDELETRYTQDNR